MSDTWCNNHMQTGKNDEKFSSQDVHWVTCITTSPSAMPIVPLTILGDAFTKVLLDRSCHLDESYDLPAMYLSVYPQCVNCDTSPPVCSTPQYTFAVKCPIVYSRLYFASATLNTPLQSSWSDTGLHKQTTDDIWGKKQKVYLVYSAFSATVKALKLCYQIVPSNISSVNLSLHMSSSV